MWKVIAHQLDKLAIRSACGSVRPSPDGQNHAEEAAVMLQQPNFFAPEVDASHVEVNADGRFEFQSPFATGPSENHFVRGRVTKAKGNWRERPSVILVHGWNAELQYEWMLPFWAELLANAGLNAVAFELPYHASRRPREEGTIRNFISGNLLHFVRATHQTLAEIRVLATWLRRAGSPAIGVWGTSLGAWLAGLAVANQPEFSSAVLLTPVVRMDRALRELAFCESIREQAAGFQEAAAILNLVSHRPLCAPENVLMVAPAFDLFAPADTISELTHAWHPEVWPCRHGHISVLLSTSTMRRIARWMAVHSEIKPASPAPRA